MMDITTSIKDAMAIEDAWSISTFYEAIEVLEQKGFEVSHWIGEENWANVALHGVEIGYLWLKYPLLLTTQKQASNLRLFLKMQLILIEVTDLNSEDLSVSEEEYIKLISYGLANYGLNWQKFSASDLWFHTVT